MSQETSVTSQGNSAPQENKMGTMPVGKLLFTMALPIIISMLIQSLYNIVDSMYVSRINENALTAVSLVFPMQNLVLSIAAGTAVGFNALLSRFLGQKNTKKATQVAQHAIFLAVVASIIVSAILLLFAPSFSRIQTDDPQIYQYTVTYMRICCGISIGIFLQVTFERLLTSTGKTLCTMISQATGAIVNIILDPILIFGYFGLPAMGVAGAAVATVIGQCIASMLGLTLNLTLNREISIRMKGFRPDRRLISEIYRIGIPSIIMMCIGSVMTFGMNLIFMQYLKNSTAAAVFGIYFKLNSMIFMPVFGLNNGLVPIVAYNYGAQHRLRIQRAIRLAILSAVIIMTIGTLVFWILPGKLLQIFDASDTMLAIGIPALRKVSLAFPLAGYCIILGSSMQALGKSFYSMINSLMRQLIVLLPCAFLLAATGGLPAVWWAFDIAELASLLLMTIFYQKVRRTYIDPLPE